MYKIDTSPIHYGVHPNSVIRKYSTTEAVYCTLYSELCVHYTLRYTALLCAILYYTVYCTMRSVYNKQSYYISRSVHAILRI